MITVNVQAILNLREILGSSELTVEIQEGSTLSNLLVMLGDRYGGRFQEAIFHKSGQPARFCLFLINGREITFLAGFQTELKNEDTITIIPPAAGG